MTAASAQGARVALIGPRETPFESDRDLEYREQMLKSYAEVFADIAAPGADYTLSREFLGIEYLASALRRAGAEVLVISASNEDVTGAELMRRLAPFAPHLVGLSLLYDLQLVSALTLARDIRDAWPGTKVVVGGPLGSAIADLLLQNFPSIDGVVLGEGETAIVALAAAILDGATLDDVPSLVHRRDGAILRNPRAAPVDLSTLAHPSRDVIASLLGRGLPVPSAYLTLSRGCKAFCTFCTVPHIVRGMKEQVYRARSAGDVVDEIEDVVATYGIRRFYMADDNFLGYGEESNLRMLAFADEVIRRGLDINFHAECRVDSLVRGTVVRLREAGFDQILFGLESGSQKTLKRWAKGQTVGQNEAAVALARELRLDIMPSMILLDWESGTDEVEESVAFIERNRLHHLGQPLWLVNKLKVHCGTAAAQRYDNVHGRPVPPPLTGTDSSLRAWAASVTYQGLRIDDPHVAAFWSALNAEANRWSTLVDAVIPTLLRIVATERRRAEPEARLRLVRDIARIRRSIGDGVAGLMRVLIDSARAAEQARRPLPDLAGVARDFVLSWERSVLGDDFGRFLGNADFRLRGGSHGLPATRRPAARPAA